MTWKKCGHREFYDECAACLRELLKKYIANVVEREGDDFLPADEHIPTARGYPLYDIGERENATLQSLNAEIGDDIRAAVAASLKCPDCPHKVAEHCSESGRGRCWPTPPPGGYAHCVCTRMPDHAKPVTER